EVRAYIENTGEWIARDTVVRLENLAPLRIVEGPASVALGDLAPRDSRQVTWRVAVPAGSSGSFTYRVSVTSSNADPNRVDRTVVVIAPAALEAALPNGEITVRDGRWGNVPLPMTARITNVGQLVAEDVVARLDTVFGLQLARGSAAERYIGPVQPGETVEVTWHLVPTGVVGNLPVSLRLTSSNASIGRLPTAFVAVPL